MSKSVLCFSDTWNSTLIKLDEFIKNVSNYLECFETDKFEAVSSGKPRFD